MSTIQAERTCSGCVHWDKYTSVHGRCHVTRENTGCRYACQQFNAPSGLRWVPERFRDKPPRWFLIGPSGYVGHIFPWPSGLYGVRYKLEKNYAEYSLTDCARALVERVKGDR